MEKIKENEFILLKSKDDYSYAHYKMAPLSVKTGFFGTAGEGIQDKSGKITLLLTRDTTFKQKFKQKEKMLMLLKWILKSLF